MGGAPRPVEGERPQACRSPCEESTLWRILFACSYHPPTHKLLAKLADDKDVSARTGGAQVPLAAPEIRQTIAIPVQAECV